MREFDPLALDLQGQILVEASAGTGKTFSIALLFLRLILEKGLYVDDVLVVTFTKAATAELRDRVRSRIRQALGELESPGSQDELLQKLIGSINDQMQARRRLKDALTRMDEAAIYTIHGFCQRMLQDHAFDSGAPFEMEFLESEGLLRRRIIEDFWRLHFYDCKKEEAEWITGHWKAPLNLLEELSGHLSRPEVRCIPEVGRDQIRQQINALEPVFAQVQTMWQGCEKEINGLLNTAVQDKHLSGNNKEGYGSGRLPSAFKCMRQLSTAELMPLRIAHQSEYVLFTQSKIEASLLKKANGVAPEHPFFTLFETFFSEHQEMSNGKHLAILLEARAYLFNELSRRKQQRGQLYFNDLLIQLDNALQSTGDNALAGRIGNRFPAILVDEFQDTDPKQYSIFSSIYRSCKPAENDAAASCLILVGDPKQAIYSFRGAEIFTYIKAVEDTKQARQFSMGINYRSTRQMVEAVNALFKRDRAFVFDKITYSPVSAANQIECKSFLLNGAITPPLTSLLLEANETNKATSKGDAHQQAAVCSAREIAELLSAGVSGNAKIDDRSLEPKDIAVLVRTHNEAELIRRELSKLAISSVYSGRESIFSSEQAKQLSLVLSCLLDLSNEARLRTALTTELFGYDAAKLDSLRQNEQKWAGQMEHIRDYRESWQNHGFSQMFHTLLAKEHAIQRLGSATDGERALTNYAHLSELLQSEDPLQPGAEGLLRWFNEQIQSPEPDADQQQLRLESDENLVKIVTIHKAKGLEYAIVFLPFLWSARACKKDEPLAFHPEDKPDEYRVYIGTNPEQREAAYERAEKERLAEDLRLLYVAFTRAKYACYFCWGHIKQMEDSALYYLLHAQPGTPEEMKEIIVNDLTKLGGKECKLQIIACRERAANIYLADHQSDGPLEEKMFTGQIDKHPPIVSHSSLTSSDHALPERPDYDQFKNTQATTSSGDDIFGFPKGAKAGICLHSILEKISFTDSAEHEQVITEQLFRAGIQDRWHPVVEAWITHILATRLSTGFALGQLDNADRLNEMSFYFSLNSLDWGGFNQILEQFSYTPLEQRGKLQGLMHGFIDLVYRHEGQYYIADYKSNYLGSLPADYGETDMQAAMEIHRYDLQYLIYTLALHRFLATRIEDYDYERHFGGVYYLFLRGMNPNNTERNGIYFKRPPLNLINALDRCCSLKTGA